ncbi:competence/damage-inducible protein A [Alkalinema pantanalense CENA528]|uniref:competence/damage-inducible protein A n=1 Tax=Alkalinema pantanalense TaxID=1620705 RepID=UPI003D6FDEAF
MTIVAEVLSVGTELLLGDILNSNAQFLAQQLAQLGIAHYYQTTVGDNPDRLRRAIELAASRAQLLIFTGGLGPTPDDLTTETIAQTFGTPLLEDPQVVADIAQKFAARGRAMTDNNRKQALRPQGAAILPNPVGTAPGMIWQPQPNVTIFTFPGVPTEMKAMWQETAIPYLQAQGWTSTTIVSRTLRFWGISESSLAERVSEFLNLTNPTVAPYANWGEVKLRISAKAESAAAAQHLIQPVEAQLRTIAGIDCYGADQDSLASVVGALLKAQGQTVAVAESCTGGGLGQMITGVSGSSEYFWGGIIAYENRIKEKILGVDPAVLQSEGAVSAIVAEQMAMGARSALGTDWGVSITGIAGPTGGTDSKPLGLVYIGVAAPDGSAMAQEYRFGNRGRDWLRQVSACSAIDQLRRQILAG